jgi:hypothetical protein
MFLTGNTDTVYASAMIDLERDGPTVVEVPPGCGPGTVNDAWFRFVIDMGAPGPDRGAGGRYLIVPDDYDGEIPSGMFEARTPSRVNWLILRGFLVDGRPDASTAMFKEGLRVYRCPRRMLQGRWSSSRSPGRCSTRSTPTTSPSTTNSMG